MRTWRIDKNKSTVKKQLANTNRFCVDYFSFRRYGCKNESFSYNKKDCLDNFLNKLKKILTDFANSERERETQMTDDQKRSRKEVKFVIYAVEML